MESVVDRTAGGIVLGEMQVFPYGQAEIDHLGAKDKRLGKLIDRVGMIRRSVSPNLFGSLVRNIVGQQISSKAAITVCQRLEEATGGITPRSLSAMAAVEIQRCGMSMRKAGYIHQIARAAMDKTVNFEQLPGLTDPEVVEQIGRASCRERV